MKAMKLFSVACCMAAMCLTSCLSDNDSDYKALTPAEVNLCLNAVRGAHTGKVIYAAPTVKDVNNTDSLDITWSITTDSTMTIHDFPAKLLTQNIDSINGKELREAIANLGEVDIDCRIGFTNLTPVQWLINPKAVTLDFKDKSGDHKVAVAFYANINYSSGYFNSTKGEMAMEIIEGLIYMDGKSTSYLKKDTPFLFVRNKK